MLFLYCIIIIIIVASISSIRIILVLLGYYYMEWLPLKVVCVWFNWHMWVVLLQPNNREVGAL